MARETYYIDEISDHREKSQRLAGGKKAYSKWYLFQINESFPKIAMSHTVHKEIGIFEMMMSLFYHPQNSHCIYIDQKAYYKVFEAVNGIVKCYKEKFLQVIATCSDKQQLRCSQWSAAQLLAKPRSVLEIRVQILAGWLS